MIIFDKNILIENITFLSQRNNISVNKALIESQAGKDFIANIKKGQIPSIEKIILISNYFNIAIDNLLTKMPASYESEQIKILQETISHISDLPGEKILRLHNYVISLLQEPTD